MFRHEEVLRVVQIRVEAVLDAVNDSRLEIDEKGARNVMLIVGLVEEDIFPVVALCRIFLQNAFSADTVLHTELFPKLVSDYARKREQLG